MRIKSHTVGILVFCSIFMITSVGLAQDGWEVQTSGSSQSLLGITMTSADVGWISVADGTLLCTTNGGMTWTPQTPGLSDPWFDVSFCNDNDGVAVSISGAIVNTTDGGNSWNIAQSGMMVSYWDAKMITPQVGLAAGKNSIFQPYVTWTRDGWQTLNNSNFILEKPFQMIEGTIHEIDAPGGLTAVAACGAFTGEGAIARTTNAGKDWETIHWTSYWLQAVDFPSEQVGYAVGDFGLIIKTSDGGDTWTDLPSGVTAMLNDVCFSNENIGTAVGSGGVIIRTTDGGATWVSQASGTTVSLNAVEFVDPNVGYAVGENGTILKTVDGGGCSLIADVYTIPAGMGGTVNFDLQAGSTNANREYVLLGGASGTSPVTPLPGGLATLPLNWDAVTDLIVAQMNSSYFSDFSGILDSTGDGTAQFNSMGPVPPVLVGRLLNFAYALRTPWDYASVPAPIKVLP